MSPSTFSALLDELGQWFEFEDCEPVDWLVCGGVAMALQELNVRTTRDMDVLGAWDAAQRQLNRFDDFVPKVKTCICRVVENHPELAGLDESWINVGPRKLVEFGLPKGFEQRLKTMRFGNRLTLRLLGRTDLLALKLYAAADDRGPRQEIHFQDMRQLAPTFDELDRAIDWVRTLPDFEEKRIEFRNVIERLGHDDLAYYI